MSDELHSSEAYQVHAFTDKPHRGNPAGVVVSPVALQEIAMAKIAVDFGPSVTAFVVDDGREAVSLRWFTRTGSEIQTYCGHATIAAAHVMLRHRRPSLASLAFNTISGSRKVEKFGADLGVFVPQWTSTPEICPLAVRRCIAQIPVACLRSQRDLLLIFGSVEELDAIVPDFDLMLELGAIGVIAAAPADQHEVAFRFFCPGFDIGENEDPATGSAISTLAPYWFGRYGSQTLRATQRSARGGIFECIADEDQVLIRSNCVTFMQGRLA